MIGEGGTVPDDIQLTGAAAEVCGSMAALHASSGYQPPWVGYLALEGNSIVGTCAFKSPPENDRVEIAYYTFPGHEGRGVATRMASLLVEIARKAQPSVRVFAQTMPEENASTSVLKKLGFRFKGNVTHPEDGDVWEWELPD